MRIRCDLRVFFRKMKNFVSADDMFLPNIMVEDSGVGQSAITQQTLCNMQFVLSFPEWNYENNYFKSQMCL